ncbi:MAG: hypothetical protein WC788_02620 [Candidatus Paceibacterota bacterium]|jgi:YHS domain-containing protein
MFNMFKKKQQKDPVCGMVADEKFISKHGEKFCSVNCLKAYEAKKQNKKTEGGHSGDKDCGCCG